MSYKIKFNATLLDVKDIDTCSVFFSGEQKGHQFLSPEIIDKINTGILLITEYHDNPLGEVLYLSAKSINN